ncbi:MAG TPA: SoxR reducing system RseC family protein [Woeseiaceae bacterium]|nr:SoxR reducing system RseC family protein [Woeseiaceae bacterium]
MKTVECTDIEQKESCEEDLARAVVTVVSVEGDRVHVESSGGAACSRCAHSGGCGTKSLLAFFGNKAVPLVLDNNLGARVGDQIEIGIEHSKILKLSALSYLLPIIGLLGGGALSAVAETSDIMALGLGLAGLGIGFAYSRHLYSSERWEREILPICMRLVSSGDEQYVELKTLG